MAALAGLAASLVAACGGTSLPETPPCPAPASTVTAGTLGGQVDQYVRGVVNGEEFLASLLTEFRAEYPEGRFYRSSAFREDWVAYAGAAGCEIDRITALTVPVEASTRLQTNDVELESILADYRNQLNAGTDSVRQRNTSDYRDFNRRVDDVAARLQAFANELEN